MINYEAILKGFLQTVSHLSDPLYQERVWVKGIGPECSSFEDDICFYFDDSEGIIQDYKLFGLSDYQLQNLKDFNVQLRSFCDTIPEIVDEKTQILPNPQWHEIQLAASKLLTTLAS